MRKTSFSNLCWSFPTDEAIKILYANKILFIELSLMKEFEGWDEIDRRKLLEIKQRLEFNNIKISSIQSIFHKTEINLFDDRLKFEDHFKKIIEFSEILETNYIVYGSPKTRDLRGKSQELAEEIYLEAFYKIQNFNPLIKIGIESNPEFYGCYFLNSYEKIKKINNSLNKNIVFHYDLACLDLGGEDAIEIYKRENENLSLIHISTKNLNSIKGDERVKQFLLESSENFNSIFSIEMLNLNKIEVQECIDFLKFEGNNE